MGKKITNNKAYESDSEEDYEEEFDQELEDEDSEGDDFDQEQGDDEEMDEEENELEYQSHSDIIDNEESDSEGSEVAAGRAGAFGNKKQDYYKDSDVTDSDDSGEEKGADEIYREQQQGLTEADFMDEDFARKSEESHNEESAEANQDPETIKQEEQERKKKLIKKLSPEIMSLAQEMKISLSEIIEELSPLLDIDEAKRIMVGKGQNYLEIRYEILMSYSICILFYLLLKAKGKVTNNHPVLDKLTKYKTHIERMNISLDDFQQKTSSIISNQLKKLQKNQKNGNKDKPMTFEEKMKLNQKQQKKYGKKESESQKFARQLLEESQKYGLYEEDNEDFGLNDSEDEMSEEEVDLLSEDEEDLRITQGAKAIKKPVQKTKTNQKNDNGDIKMDDVKDFLGDDEDDGDMLLQEPKKVNLNKIKQQQNKKQKEVSEDYKDDFYKQVQQQQITDNISKKKQRILEKEQKKEQIAKSYNIRELNEGESRRVTSQIINNKGNLVRKRKQGAGNAKLVYRQKYEKKLKAHNRQKGGKVYEKQNNNYVGELGAIKIGAIKSTKFQN